MSWDKFKKFANSFTWRTYANCLCVVLVVCVYQNISMSFAIDRLVTANHQLIESNARLTSKNTELATAHSATSDTKQLKAQIVHLKHLLGVREKQLTDLQVKTTVWKPVPTLAMKNNNPLNVKKSSNGAKWKGQIGVDQHGHVVFGHILDGIRAGAIVLMKYATVHKIDTIDGILKRFCTGNRAKYATFLSKRLNLDRTAKFNIQERLPELLQAMARFESGQEFPMHYFRPFDLVAGL